MNPDGTEQNKLMMLNSKKAKTILREKLKKFDWEKYEINMTFPVISRRESHFRKPFEQNKTKLNWFLTEYKEHKDPIYQKWKLDPKIAREDFMKLQRVYLVGTIKGQLEAKKEPKEKIEKFVDEFIEGYADSNQETMKLYKEDAVIQSIAMIMKKP